jgi:hypothetical protein
MGLLVESWPVNSVAPYPDSSLVLLSGSLENLSARFSIILDQKDLQDLSLHAAVLLDIAHSRLQSCFTLFGQVARIGL